MAMTEAGVPVWCTAWSREAEESPLGTAVGADRFVLVELPLPWPSDIETHELLAPALADRLADTSARVLALGCEKGCSAQHTVICYWRDPSQPFSGFHRWEAVVDRAELADEVRRLVAGQGMSAAPVDEVSDFLLCTHGKRDRCCGKLGGRLFEDLRREMPAAWRLWRTSHTGGHRFAPTGMTFPDGFVWAGLDAPTARGLMDGNLPAEQALPHVRGCAGFVSGPVQVADAQGFARHGWSWCSSPRTAEILSDEGGCASVKVKYEHDGHSASFDAIVERGRTLPIALCGEPIAAAVKQTTELVLRSVTSNDA